MRVLPWMTELGRTDLVKHHVDTGDQAPVRQRARREPFALRAKVREMVDDMLRSVVIQPYSSPWASPISMVKKRTVPFDSV